MASRVFTHVFALYVALTACGGGDGGLSDANRGEGSGGGRDAGPPDTGAPDGATPEDVVALSDGLLRGESVGSTWRFLGVPFAAPPLGDLRWRPPQPVQPWQGIRDATSVADACAQLSASVAPAPRNSEDCLYLNVWTPELTPDDPAPVMVWIHGGANLIGSATRVLAEVPGGAPEDKLRFDGGRFIEAAPRPVVVVTINYRLGMLGFLAHPGLTAEEGSSGNYAVLDQQAALRWVRDNIAMFGGDPDNVTLFGQSAGGKNTCLQMMAPGSAELIDRAIMQSANDCFTPRWWQSLEQAESGGTAAAEELGCSGGDEEVLECLRGLSTEEVLALPGAGADGPGGLIYAEVPAWDFRPIVDGVVLPELPTERVAADRHNRIPVIIGSNAADGSFFHHSLVTPTPVADEDQYRAALEHRFGDRADDVLAEYPVADYDSPNDALAEVTGDSIFTCPARNLARALADSDDGVFEYVYTHDLGFTRVTGLGLGPTHGAEIPLVWNNAAIVEGATEADERLTAVMIDLWTRFAHTGDPNGEGAPPWPRFEIVSEPEIELTDPVGTVEGRKSAECDFWATLY